MGTVFFLRTTYTSVTAVTVAADHVGRPRSCARVYFRKSSSSWPKIDDNHSPTGWDRTCIHPARDFLFSSRGTHIAPHPSGEYARSHLFPARSDDVSDDDLHVPQRRVRMRFISPQTAVTAAAAGQNGGGPICRTHLLRFMNFRRRYKHVPVCLCVEVVGFRQRINELFAA